MVEWNLGILLWHSCILIAVRKPVQLHTEPKTMTFPQPPQYVQFHTMYHPVIQANHIHRWLAPSLLVSLTVLLLIWTVMSKQKKPPHNMVVVSSNERT